MLRQLGPLRKRDSRHRRVQWRRRHELALRRSADYNAADKQLWADMVTLPLYQKPQFYAWTNTYGNIVPNASSTGVPWNAQPVGNEDVVTKP